MIQRSVGFSPGSVDRFQPFRATQPWLRKPPQLWLKQQTSGSSVTDVTDYLRRASLLLMKLKWAGSQTKPAERHASTQDWPSCDTSSLRELRGGQTGGAETVDHQPRAVEFGRGTKRGPVVLVPPAEPGLEKLAGTKRGSVVQKSCRCKTWRLAHCCQERKKYWNRQVHLSDWFGFPKMSSSRLVGCLPYTTQV